MSFSKIYSILKIFTCEFLPGPIIHFMCAIVLNPWLMKVKVSQIRLIIIFAVGSQPGGLSLNMTNSQGYLKVT